MLRTWWHNQSERARQAKVAKTFRRNLVRALTERLELPPHKAASYVAREVASMIQVPQFELGEGSLPGTAQFVFSLSRQQTKDLASRDFEPLLFAVTLAVVRALLQSFREIEAVRCTAEGVLLDRKGWEFPACVLSVEATREVADSLNWDTLEDKQVFENFDLRYASGKQILAHGSEPDMDAGIAEELITLSPTDFERRIVNLFEAMGYVVEHTGRTGDHGIDLVATNNAAITGGKFVIQCKRYAEGNNVGESEVRDLYGVVSHERASKGILVTTSDFTSAARMFATDKQLELINGGKLAELLETHLGKPRPSPETPGVPNAEAR